LLGAVDRQLLDLVRRRAALIITAARIALGIFVGEHRSLSLEHGARDDIFRRDQLDLVLLAFELGGDGRSDRRIGLRKAIGEEAVGLDLAQGAAAHLDVSPGKRGLDNLSMRRWWRPPAKSVPRKASTQA